MLKQFITIATLLSGMITFAQNPISPLGVYIADPAAHVWKDGRLYVYGSLDITTDYFTAPTGIMRFQPAIWSTGPCTAISSGLLDVNAFFKRSISFVRPII